MPSARDDFIKIYYRHGVFLSGVASSRCHRRRRVRNEKSKIRHRQLKDQTILQEIVIGYDSGALIMILFVAAGHARKRKKREKRRDFVKDDRHANLK